MPGTSQMHMDMHRIKKEKCELGLIDFCFIITNETCIYINYCFVGLNSMLISLHLSFKEKKELKEINAQPYVTTIYG